MSTKKLIFGLSIPYVAFTIMRSPYLMYYFSYITSGLVYQSACVGGNELLALYVCTLISFKLTFFVADSPIFRDKTFYGVDKCRIVKKLIFQTN